MHAKLLADLRKKTNIYGENIYDEDQVQLHKHKVKSTLSK